MIYISSAINAMDVGNFFIRSTIYLIKTNNLYRQLQIKVLEENFRNMLQRILNYAIK